MEYICGFYAVNGKHCWINGHCVVCKVTEGTMKNKLQFDTARLEQLVNMGKTQLQKAGKNGKARLSKFTRGLNTAPARKIEVQQRGLATGQRVFVRVKKRIHIPVKYIESN